MDSRPLTTAIGRLWGQVRHQPIVWDTLTTTVLSTIGRGGLESNADSVSQVQQILREYRPDLVCLPVFLGSHKEHVKANDVLLTTAERCRATFDCCAYEVGSLLHANMIVDATHHMETRIEALREYRTALKVVDYARSVRGLNMFRSATCAHGARRLLLSPLLLWGRGWRTETAQEGAWVSEATDSGEEVGYCPRGIIGKTGVGEGGDRLRRS